MGSKSRLVFVNSSWTRAHIESLWGLETNLLYPPCNTEQYLEIEDSPRDLRVVSVGQFRPEKDHALQVRAFARFVSDTDRRDVQLTLVGGVRNKEDEARVDGLRSLVKELEVEDLVTFEVGVPYERLFEILSTSLIGLHTMWNEHFGIGVVEFMAAGIIPIAHDSGGPKMDIVVPGSGYLATTDQEYAAKIKEILSLSESQLRDMRRVGREHVKSKFSDGAFRGQFIEHFERVTGVEEDEGFEEDWSEVEEEEEENNSE